MNLYNNITVNLTYLSNLMENIKSCIDHNDTLFPNQDPSESISQLIDEYEQETAKITGISAYETLSTHLTIQNTDIRRLAQEIIADISTQSNSMLQPKEKLLTFLTPYFKRDNHSVFFHFLETATHSLALYRNNHSRRQSIVDTTKLLIKTAINIEACPLRTKEIIENSTIINHMSELKSLLPQVNTIDSSFYFDQINKFELFINGNIRAIANDIIENIKNNENDKLAPVKKNISQLYSILLENYTADDTDQSPHTVNYQQIKTIADFFEDYACKSCKRATSYTIKNMHPMYLMETLHQFDGDPFDPLMLARELHVYTGTLGKNKAGTIEDACNEISRHFLMSIPIDKDQVDRLFYILESIEKRVTDLDIRPYSDTIIASVNVIDTEHFHKKLKERHQGDTLTIHTPILKQHTAMSEIYLKHLSKVIDLLAKDNPQIQITNLDKNHITNLITRLKQKDNDPAKQCQAIISGLCDVIDQSTFLSENLNSSFNWISKELLETKIGKSTQSKYLILATLTQKDSFIRWLIQDQQLQEDGISNQVIAGRKMLTRIFNVKTIDSSSLHTLKIVANELMKKDRHSFTQHYMKKTPFRERFEHFLLAHLSSYTLSNIEHKEVFNIAANIEQKSLTHLYQNSEHKPVAKHRAKL